MKARWVGLGILVVSFLCIGVGGEALAKGVPVAMMTQVKGDVQYSKNGTKWKKVRRNKFLFAGYQIKTGGHGSGKLVNQTTNLTRDMGPNSHVKITKDGVTPVSGTLSDPKKGSGDLMASLNQRFSKAQRYTTVRRSVERKHKLKLATVKQVTLSNAYPDLVWTNMGQQYTYRLVIDGKTRPIAAVSGDFVRYSVAGLAAGKHEYRVEIMKDGTTVYVPKKNGHIRWLSQADVTAFEKGQKEMESFAPQDDLVMATYMDDQGFTVAAMDLYRKYFTENPDDNDMRPMLIKAYHDLKLKKLKKEEAVRYNMMLDAE